MCRNIRKLRRTDHRLPTDAELHDAALQFVRKISGYHEPSKVNQKAFETAVHSVAKVARVMFGSLQTHKHRHAA